MAKADAPSFVQARESFLHGALEVKVGDIFPTDDPLVRRIPHLFIPLVVRRSVPAAPPVEQATAAPGEKRGR